MIWHLEFKRHLNMLCKFLSSYLFYQSKMLELNNSICFSTKLPRISCVKFPGGRKCLCGDDLRYLSFREPAGRQHRHGWKLMTISAPQLPASSSSLWTSDLSKYHGVDSKALGTHANVLGLFFSPHKSQLCCEGTIGL